jgi:uncharacterized protein (DUF58 family)
MAARNHPYLDPLAVSKLRNMEVRARLIVEGFITGLHRSPYHGFSVEFAEHRPYNTGESLRAIDWKVYARTDKLFTKKFEEETNLLCNVVLDVSDSMRYPTGQKDRLSKLAYGAYLAAALGWLMIQQKDAVGLSLFDDELRYFAPPKARLSWLLPLLAELEKVAAQAADFTRRTRTPAVLHQLAGRLRRRGMVVLITDLLGTPQDLDMLMPALQHLRHAHHEVIIFNLLDRTTELDFALPNLPYIIQDLETGDRLKVHPAQVRDRYKALMGEYLDTVRRRCRELQIELIEVDVQQNYEKTLRDYFIKRQILTRKR